MKPLFDLMQIDQRDPLSFPLANLGLVPESRVWLSCPTLVSKPKIVELWDASDDPASPLRQSTTQLHQYPAHAP